MERMSILTVMIAIVLMVVAVQTVQISFLSQQKISATGAVIASSSGAIDMTGWTEDEKMMYEHHGTIPARFQQSSVISPGTGMVGGC